MTTLPHSIESEKGVISALLQDPSRIFRLRTRLETESFYQESHRTIYSELLTMENENIPIDVIALTNRLRDQRTLDRVGGVAELMELFAFIPSPTNYEHYVSDVQARFRQRRAIAGFSAALEIVSRHEPSEDLQSTINDAQAAILTALDGRSMESTSATLTECLYEHMEHMATLTERIQAGQTPLIPTGIPSLDRASGGIGQDEFWLVTGPTKSGKSVLTGCIGVHAAHKGFKTKIYTNEVGRRTYAGRILASAAEGIDGTIERKGINTRQQQDAYARAQNDLMRSIGKVISIDNASGKYVEDIVADIRQESESGTKLVIVDLIGKIRTRQSFASRERELSHISLSLYESTKRYKCACIVVAQENEDGQVRESRSIAMDCEAWIKVCHVFNQPEKKRFAGAAEPEMIRDRRDILVELARGFAAGDKIRCIFDGGRFLIRELSNDDWTER
jgi:replicative DNA helicase